MSAGQAVARWIVVLGLVLATGLAGCGGGGGAGQTPSPTPTGAGDVTAALLPAADMPAWNGAITWRADPQPAEGMLGLCALPGSADPAQEARQATRTYSATSLRGVNVITVLPDADAASRWVSDHAAALRRCAPGPGGPSGARSTKVGDLPTGSTWAVSAPTGGDDTRFEFIGVARQGRVVTMVGLTLQAQDANVEGDPLEASLAASLERIRQVLPEAAGATPTATASPTERAVPVYYVAGWGTDLRLAREFHRGPVDSGAQALAVEAVTQMLSTAPLDPDYGSLWNPSTRVMSIGCADGVITIDLSPEAREGTASGQAAEATVQQLVYTATAALGVDDPVRLLVGGRPAGLMWETVDWSQPISRAPELDVRLLVEIGTPLEGAAVGRTFTVTGLAATDEAVVDWRLTSTEGGTVADGTARTAEAGRMAPFQFDVALPNDVAAGQYRIEVAQTDLSGGVAEPGPMRDDKQVNVG